jgi:hypothetical protein
MLKEENTDIILNESKKISLIELEEMIQNGITPPDIKEIDDMPKEEWLVQEKNEGNEIENEIENKTILKRATKPWEKKESNITNINL